MIQHKTACSTVLRTRNLKISDHNDCGTAKHTLDTGHHWDYENPVILATVANEKHRILRESMKIFCHQQKGITFANIMEGTEINPCWYEVLKT